MNVGTKTPEEWLRFITNERKTYNGPNKYKYWMQLYRRAADSIPADEFAHNNNAYAKIMVDFAKLQARTSEDDARTIFQAARSNGKHCSLIYVAWAQFELLNDNRKKCKKLLVKGKQFCAEPGYLLEKALKNFESGNEQLIDDETEEYTFTELINKNVSKTEDYTDHLVKPRQRTSDSSIESTSSLSPESVHFTESSEESDEGFYLRAAKPSRSNNLACIEESPHISLQDEMEKQVMVVSTSASEGAPDQLAETDVQSSLCAFKENQSNVPTQTTAMVLTQRNAHAEDSHLTMKPSSSDFAPKRFTLQNSTVEEFVQDSKSSVVKDIGSTVPSEPRSEASGLASLSSLKDEGRLSASSEGSDDIDALSFKKSLLNFGNKTGLMNFVTPQNKQSEQSVVTKADANISGSLVKGRKSNRRAKRSVFIGLPQRVPKLTNDKSKDKQGVEDASEKNIEMKNEPVIKTKESDGVDGVFAFPRDDEPSDAQAQDTPVSEAQCLDVRNIKKEDGISVSKSRISLEKISTKPPHSNTQHLGHDKENIFPPKCDLDISSVVGKISIENKCKSTVYLRNNPNLSSTKVPSTDECAKTKSDICSTAPPDRRTGKPHEPGPELRQRTPLASIGLDIVNKPPQMVSSQLENRVQKCRDEKPSQYTGKTFQSAHFNQKSTLNGNTGAQHGSAIQKNSFTHTAGSDEIKTPHTSCNNNSKSTSLSFTLASNAISNDSSSASSGLSHLSMAGIKHGMHEMSRMTAQNSSAIQNVTVNGKTYNKLNMIGRGGSSEVYTVFDGDYSQYALKYVDIKGADASVVESYVNEITLLKRLQGHESIIKLYDWEMDEVNKVIKIVLERGSTDLAGYLKKNPDEITVDFIKMCWRKMLDAVDVIHKEGIIHSDLKPANFLLVEWNLKLIDFGIANAIQSDVTSFYRDSTIGTLSYMSPEALKDVSQSHDQGGQHKPMMKIGRPSDVWSLGCILYVMVYGKTPFQHIRNNFQKWSCIIDPSYDIKFPPIKNQDLLDSMKGCLRRIPSERYTIAQLKSHPFLTGRISDHDVDNVLNCLMQMQDINSPTTLRTFAQNLVGHLSSGSSLSIASAQPCQKSKGK